jgi:hypothetical protein
MTKNNDDTNLYDESLSLIEALYKKHLEKYVKIFLTYFFIIFRPYTASHRIRKRGIDYLPLSYFSAALAAYVILIIIHKWQINYYGEAFINFLKFEKQLLIYNYPILLPIISSTLFSLQSYIFHKVYKTGYKKLFAFSVYAGVSLFAILIFIANVILFLSHSFSQIALNSENIIKTWQALEPIIRYIDVIFFVLYFSHISVNCFSIIAVNQKCSPFSILWLLINKEATPSFRKSFLIWLSSVTSVTVITVAIFFFVQWETIVHFLAPPPQKIIAKIVMITDENFNTHRRNEIINFYRFPLAKDELINDAGIIYIWYYHDIHDISSYRYEHFNKKFEENLIKIFRNNSDIIQIDIFAKHKYNILEEYIKDLEIRLEGYGRIVFQYMDYENLIQKY